MMLLSRSVGWSSRRRGRNRRRIPQVALIATVALSVAGCAVDLGTLGGTSSFALDINDRGVTVGRSDTADGSTHAFRKRPGRPMRDLNGSFVQSVAVAVNDRGVVVGQGWVTDTEAHVVVWDRRGRPHDLGTGEPADINDDGLVVGTRGGDPVVWDTATGEVEVLPDPPNPEGRTLYQVIPTAINDAGAIVGEVWFDFAIIRDGVLWAAGSHEPVLLPRPGARGTSGRWWASPGDINEDGTIAGWATTATSAYGAVVWRAGTHEPVDITPPGADSAVASGINDHGQVVGSLATSTGPGRAFRWDPETGRAVDLGDLGLSASASAINNAGVAAGWADTAESPGRPAAIHAAIFVGGDPIPA
jgi:probable HAF family extracellular repeat protein